MVLQMDEQFKEQSYLSQVASDSVHLSMPNYTTSYTPASSASPLTLSQFVLVIASSIVSVFGLFSYGTYIYIVRKHRNVFSNPFYTFALSLALPDCLTNLAMLCYTYPVNLARIDFYWPSVGWAVGLAMDFTWFALVSHVAVIATNRMMAVTYYTKVTTIFSSVRIKFVLVLCYTFAVSMTALEYSCGCGQFLVEDSWTLNCDPRWPTYSGHWPLAVDMYVSNGIVLYVLLANVLIVILARRATRKILQQEVKDKNKMFQPINPVSAQRAASERSLIIQCAFVSLVLALYQGSFWFMGYLKANGAISNENAAVTENFLATLNSAMNPLIYFTFSSEIRRRVRTIGQTPPMVLQKLVAAAQKNALTPIRMETVS